MVVLSNGCTAVNHGHIIVVENGLEVELLGQGYSNHLSNAVATYVRNYGGIAQKIMFVVNGQGQFVVKFFERPDSLESYRNNIYRQFRLIPVKYQNIYMTLSSVYKRSFVS